MINQRHVRGTCIRVDRWTVVAPPHTLVSMLVIQSRKDSSRVRTPHGSRCGERVDRDRLDVIDEARIRRHAALGQTLWPEAKHRRHVDLAALSHTNPGESNIPRGRELARATRKSGRGGRLHYHEADGADDAGGRDDAVERLAHEEG